MQSWILLVVDVLLKIVKSIFGMDAPRKETVTHAEQEVKIDDGKTDKERLNDLGL